MTGYPGWPKRVPPPNPLPPESPATVGYYLMSNDDGGEWSPVVGVPSPGGFQNYVLRSENGQIVWDSLFQTRDTAFAAYHTGTADSYCYATAYDETTNVVYSVWDVYTPTTEYGVIRAVDGFGTLVWNRQIGNGTDTAWASDILLANGLLYVNYYEDVIGQGIIGMDPATGNVLWTVDTSHDWRPIGVTSGGLAVYSSVFGTSYQIMVLTPQGTVYVATNASVPGLAANLDGAALGPDDAVYVLMGNASGDATVIRLTIPSEDYTEMTQTTVLNVAAISALDIHVDKNGHLYLLAMSGTDIDVYSYTSGGTFRWSRRITATGKQGVWNGRLADPKGGIMLPMRDTSPPGNIYLIRINPNGLVDEAHNINGYTGYARATQIEVHWESISLTEDRMVATIDTVIDGVWMSVNMAAKRRVNKDISGQVFGAHVVLKSAFNEIGTGFTVDATVLGTPASATALTFTPGAYGGSVVSASLANSSNVTAAYTTDQLL